MADRKTKVILATFAGRQDRMDLLTHYVAAAMEMGLVDEFHVWNFARKPEDLLWLQTRFPYAQLTSGLDARYVRLDRTFRLEAAATCLVACGVKATNDVHIALARVGDDGPSYEIVLGGWSNQSSAIRKLRPADLKTDDTLVVTGSEKGFMFATPNLLDEFDVRRVQIHLAASGIRVVVDEAVAFELNDPVPPGEFRVFYKTGYNADGDWRWPSAPKERLFASGNFDRHADKFPRYSPFFQYYGAHQEEYADAIFLKCDDDMLYFDLGKLQQFIAFRASHPEFFLLSANVINNGVCAYFQQMSGAIPREVMQIDHPRTGLAGPVWSSGDAAERIHRCFLADPAAFSTADPDTVIWNHRISVNFVSWLGRDIRHIPDRMIDDEHDMCYGVRKRTGKSNAIYMPFTAAHLSFGSQDPTMDTGAIIAAYRDFALTTGLAPFLARREPEAPRG